KSCGAVKYPCQLSLLWVRKRSPVSSVLITPISSLEKKTSPCRLVAKAIFFPSDDRVGLNAPTDPGVRGKMCEPSASISQIALTNPSQPKASMAMVRPSGEYTGSQSLTSKPNLVIGVSPPPSGLTR